MWKYTPTGASIREGKAWTDVDGIQHPANWNVWSAEAKAAMGLTEIVYETPPDSRLYHWGQNPDGTITKTPKNLDDVKAAMVKEIKNQLRSLLLDTDWEIVRKADNGRPVNNATKAHRDALRDSCDAKEAAINGATTTDEMATVLASEVMQWPVSE